MGLVIASFGFGISLIMFQTGSMSPTIPAGSLAVVREIPAREIRVGDVMTIDRDNALPITHRVTSVSPDQGEFRSLTMRGDANTSDDPVAYVVDTGRIAMWSMPGLASVVVWFSNPLVLGSLSISMALLVTWAFWPRARDRKIAA
jgi:signal peptidase